MLNNLKINTRLWALTSILALFAALIGVVNLSIYRKVVSSDLLPAVFAPDLLTVFASVLVLILVLFTKKDSYKNQVVILGILGYYFYSYGIYVIERVYNPLYLVYMAIFALSFWSLIYGIMSLNKASLAALSLPKGIRFLSIGLSLLQPAVFYPLWISQLVPLMLSGQKIEFLYSIYILDLCFIMPGFLIISYKMIKNQGIGLLLAPTIFILGFIEIFSLAVVDIIKPFFHANPGTGGVAQSLVLSLAFLLMAIFHLKGLKFGKEK